jgi:hypothetical protein
LLNIIYLLFNGKDQVKYCFDKELIEVLKIAVTLREENKQMADLRAKITAKLKAA